MGFITPDLPDVDPETWHDLPAVDQDASGDSALGGARFRNPIGDLSAVRGQDGCLCRRGCGGHRTNPGSGRAGTDRGVVDAADRVPEGRHLHPAVRGAGPGLWIGSAHGAVLAADRRLPVLVAAQDDSPSTLAREVPFTRGDTRTVIDVGPLRGRAGLRRLGVAVARPWRIRHRDRRCRSDQSGSGGARRSLPWRCWACATRRSSWRRAASTTG